MNIKISLITLLTTVMFFTPTMGFAGSVRTNTNVIGITETTYTALRNATCDYESTIRCGALIDKLAGMIVMRVEHNGEMYMVSEPFDLPLLKRYIPNGLYKTGKGDDVDYFLAVDGYKILLTSKNAYQRIMKMTRNGGATSISEEDFGDVMTQCEYHPETGQTRTNYDACVVKYNHGQELYKKLKGRMIMRVEHNGELYYIDANSDLSPSSIHILSDPMKNNNSFFTFVKEQSTHVDRALMKQIISGVDQFLK